VAFAADKAFFAALLVFAILLFHRAWLRAGLAAVLGAVVALVIAAALGHLWPEPRPFVAGHFAPLVPHGSDPGFPSDHLTALGAMTAGAWLAWRRVGLVLLLVSLVVAAGRVLAGLHYPVDVLAGFVTGGACASLAWRLLRAVDWRLYDIEDRVRFFRR
jgi:undecaprenyl-diphosphatase